MQGQRGLFIEEKGNLRGVETGRVPLEGALLKSMQTKHSKAQEGKQKKKEPCLGKPVSIHIKGKTRKNKASNEHKNKEEK